MINPLASNFHHHFLTFLLNFSKIYRMFLLPLHYIMLILDNQLFVTFLIPSENLDAILVLLILFLSPTVTL